MAVPRTPLAAVVCPSAPFLAPRLLRATVAVPHSWHRSLSSSAQCAAAHATRDKRSGRSYFLDMRRREQQLDRRAKGKQVSGEASPEAIEFALEWQKTLQSRNMDAMMQHYPAAQVAGLIDSRATYALSQVLHEAIRRDAARNDGSRRDALLVFAAQLVADLKFGRVPPSPFAYVHLLGAYKDARRFADGAALWAWLAAQDDAHCSQAAYGAAIELLSYGGLRSLPQLEALYEEGLARFPGTFAAYHLSPDAVVPDRAQPVHIIGLPTVLLQGIITARLRAHDWPRAYLALDTILRLYPAQTPHRIFELFITERPLFEAYTAYLLACRSGVQISGGQVTTLLNRLRVAMTQAPALHDRFTLLRAMANALYAFQQCGAPLKSVHVGQLIKAFEFLLPDKAPLQDFTAEQVEMRNIIALTAQQCVADLIQAGLSLSYHPFVSLISLAGKLRAPELFKQTLADANTAGITFYGVERRTLLTAAGLIKDRDLVKALWSLTVASAETQGAQLTYNDWITFAKACRRAEYTHYFDQQLREQAHSITSAVEKRVRAEISNSEPGPAQPSMQLMTPDELKAEFALLDQQLKNIRAVLMSGRPLDMAKSPFYMHIDPSLPSLGTPEDLLTIYNEFTTDPHQPPADPSTPAPAPAVSTTRVPLSTLRRLNWINIHEMMHLASLHAAQNKTTIEKAIIQRKSPKHIAEPLVFPSITPAPDTDSLRERIKALRSPEPTYTPGQIFRKIGSIAKQGTPVFHNTVKTTPPPAKTSKPTPKTPAAEPPTHDPTTSRWIPRRPNAARPPAVASEFESYASEGPGVDGTV